MVLDRVIKGRFIRPDGANSVCVPSPRSSSITGGTSMGPLVISDPRSALKNVRAGSR